MSKLHILILFSQPLLPPYIFFFFFLMIRRPPRSTLFPYTTLFRSPPQLAALALQNKKVIYGLLLRASAETLLEVARNPTYLGAEIGFFSVLHTWNQKLQIHPHVHCVVPAGGIPLDHTRGIRSHPRFFLPIPVLREV